MRLIELQLTNIKSYKQETIRFSEGINCILGLNGSGKSTIIESIGSVLFNYNQRTTNNLLRYNETKGQISLLFEGNDNKLYKIIKTLRNKGNSNIKIIDEENNQVLHETVSDVYEFVKKVLNIPKEKSISKMFEEIIAVPQGTFVNAFLETPKFRKDNFDKLFELDIYKKLADELKVLSDKVEKEYIFNLEKEIATLEGNLSGYENKQQESKELEDKLKELKVELEKINTKYNKKREEKEVLEKQVLDLEKLNNDKKEVLNLIDNINGKTNIYKESLEQAIQAQKLLKDNLFGYNLYKKTSEDLKVNELLYNEFLDLNDKINKNNISISQFQQDNKYLKQTIQDLKIQLGITRQQVIDKEEDNKSKKELKVTLEKEIKQVQEKIKQLDEEKTNTQVKHSFYLDKLNNINGYLLSINTNNNLETNTQKQQEIDQKLALIDNNKKQIIELEKERIKLTSDLNSLKINSNYINDGLCPILKQKCLNIKGNNLTEEINIKISQLESQINDINKKINSLNGIVDEEESLKQAKEIILLEINSYQRENERYKAVIDDILNTFEHENLEINKQNDKQIVSELIRKYQNLYDNYENKELDELKKQELDMSNKMFSSSNQININDNLIKEYQANITKYNEDISKKEKDLSKNEIDINKLETENNKNSQKLEKYQNIKQKIDDNKSVLEKYLSSYNTYISKESEANNKEKYQKLIDENNSLLEINNKKINEIEEEIKKLDSNISKENLKSLTTEVNELFNKLSVINNSISINEELFNKVIEELKILNGYIESKKHKEDELVKYNNLDNKYKLIRNVFSNLPKELSKQIRKYISTYSSNLYRKISGENVRIELLDDYEVVLIDCLDESKAKSLSQLSGGEQMSVAIAIRLAMLKQITNVEIYFMDEPTINLDYERRMMVGEVVKDISSELRQLFVISHDDTFESITDNNIKIAKANNVSILEN